MVRRLWLVQNGVEYEALVEEDYTSSAKDNAESRKMDEGKGYGKMRLVARVPWTLVQRYPELKNASKEEFRLFLKHHPECKAVKNF